MDCGCAFLALRISGSMTISAGQVRISGDHHDSERSAHAQLCIALAGWTTVLLGVADMHSWMLPPGTTDTVPDCSHRAHKRS